MCLSLFRNLSVTCATYSNLYSSCPPFQLSQLALEDYYMAILYCSIEVSRLVSQSEDKEEGYLLLT